MFSFVITQLQQNTQVAATNDSGALVGWMLAFLMALAVVTLVVRPLLFTETVGRNSSSEKNRLRLENLQDKVTAEKQSLQDLELDYELGSIEEKDYSFFHEKTVERLTVLAQEISQVEQKINPVAVTLPVVAENGSKPKNGQTAASAVTNSVKKITGEFTLKGLIKDKLKCGECGTGFKPGSRFCSSCSAPLPLLCLTCGKEITQDDRFCSKCGSAVNT